MAPKAVGVFALGRYTVGLGEASVGSGAPTPALLAATAAAARELSASRTRPELPLLWWGVPWWFARQIPGHLLPRRLQSLLKVWAVGVAAAAVVNGVQVGHPSVIVLVGLAATDLCIRGIRARQRLRQQRRSHPRLQSAPPVLSTTPPAIRAA